MVHDTLTYFKILFVRILPSAKLTCIHNGGSVGGFKSILLWMTQLIKIFFRIVVHFDTLNFSYEPAKATQTLGLEIRNREKDPKKSGTFWMAVLHRFKSPSAIICHLLALFSLNSAVSYILKSNFTATAVSTRPKHESATMSQQGFGCMGFSAFYSGARNTSDQAAAEVFHAAIDGGVTLFNSATFYGPLNEDGFGENLRLIKKCLNGKDLSKIQLMVKIGMDTRAPVSATGS